MILLSVAVFPLLGRVVDTIGCKTVLLAGTASAIVVTLPGFLWLGRVESQLELAAVQGVLFIPLCLFGAAVPLWMVQSVPSDVRYTVVGVGYNAAQALVGGPAPLVSTELVALGQRLHTPPAVFVGCYFMCIAVVSTAAVVYDSRSALRRSSGGSEEAHISMGSLGMRTGSSSSNDLSSPILGGA